MTNVNIVIDKKAPKTPGYYLCVRHQYDKRPEVAVIRRESDGELRFFCGLTTIPLKRLEKTARFSDRIDIEIEGKEG